MTANQRIALVSLALLITVAGGVIAHTWSGSNTVLSANGLQRAWDTTLGAGPYPSTCSSAMVRLDDRCVAAANFHPDAGMMGTVGTQNYAYCVFRAADPGAGNQPNVTLSQLPNCIDVITDTFKPSITCPAALPANMTVGCALGGDPGFIPDCACGDGCDYLPQPGSSPTGWLAGVKGMTYPINAWRPGTLPGTAGKPCSRKTCVENAGFSSMPPECQ